MLRTRIITALIVAPIALVGVFVLPPFEFSIFVGAIIVVAGWEWGNLAGLKSEWQIIYAACMAFAIGLSNFLPSEYVITVGILWWLVALIFVLRYPSLSDIWASQKIVLLVGFLALVPGWVALKQLKLFADSSYVICLLFFLIWGADIGAYFVGRAFGRRKLASKVSPGKTWEGFFGGLLVVLAIAISMTIWSGELDLYSAEGIVFLGVCLLVGMISVLGDLVVSMFKRRRSIKDSSNLLPGHGGFLDRIDSLLSAAPVFTFYLLFANGLP